MPILIKINVPVINCNKFRGDNFLESTCYNVMLYPFSCELFMEAVIVLSTILTNSLHNLIVSIDKSGITDINFHYSSITPYFVYLMINKMTYTGRISR